MGIARSVAAEKGILKGSKVTQGWWRRSCERQPDLSLRRGDVTAHVRMDAVNSETLTQYFTLLRDVLTEHDIFAKPAQIYNVDESGIPFDPRAPNVVAKKEQRKCVTDYLGRRGRLLLWGVPVLQGKQYHPWSYSTQSD